jgi:hypothetical protein
MLGDWCRSLSTLCAAAVYDAPPPIRRTPLAVAPAQARVGVQGGKGGARQVTKRPTLKMAEPGKQMSAVLCGLHGQRTGCSMGQGLYAARPTPLDATALVLRAHACIVPPCWLSLRCAPMLLLCVERKCYCAVLLSMHDDAGRGCCVPIQGS